MSWNFGSCAKRATKLEWMDMPDTSDSELSRMYDFIETTSKQIGSWSSIIGIMNSFSRRWSSGQPIGILELGCGRGDFTCALADWAQKKKRDIQILAVDRYGRQIQMAKEKYGNRTDITFDVQDISDPIFQQAQQFDYVISHLDFHRVDESQAEFYLKTMDLQARRGIIVFDTLRDSRAMMMMAGLSKFWRDEIVCHDGPHSIRRSFTMSELVRFKNKTRLDYARIKPQFGFRFCLYGERRYVMEPKFNPVRGFVGT